MMLMPESGVFMQSRANQGGETTRLTGRAGAAPVWLRLVRQGNQFTGYTFNKRDVLDGGGYDDDQHDRRCVCRAGGYEPRRL